MNRVFEELDYQHTPMGAISLRCRSEPRLDGKLVYEVKLDDEFLMSSLFTQAEEALARLGLAGLKGDALDVVVGGLGLGYTAATVLQDDRVRTLTVIDIMAPVIEWHRQRLLPLGKTLTTDARCALVEANFFKLAADTDAGFDPGQPAQLVHAVLLDIDHSPAHLLNPSHAGFYTRQGLATLAGKLHPGGIFGLWSNDPPDTEFKALLNSVFESSDAQIVEFDNPYSGATSANTVYLARHSHRADPTISEYND